MAALAAMVLPPLLTEDDDLLAALVLDDRGRNPRTLEERLPERDGLAVAHRQHLAELDRLAGRSPQPFYLNDVLRRDAILLPARANHSEHGNHPCWEARGAPRSGRTIGAAFFLSIVGLYSYPSGAGRSLRELGYEPLGARRGRAVRA